MFIIISSADDNIGIGTLLTLEVNNFPQEGQEEIIAKDGKVYPFYDWLKLP